MIKLGFAFVMVALVAAPAAGEPRSATVSVSRADFATPQAKAQLYRRVRGAIEIVCGSYAAIESSQSAEMDKCWTDARAQTEVKLTGIARAASVEISSREGRVSVTER